MDDMKPYSVYVKTDSAGRIIAINSDAFLSDLTGWEKIDEGYERRHYHAQNNYLPKPTCDDRDIYRYKLVDGKPVERTEEEMESDRQGADTPSPTVESRVQKLEAENAYLKEALDLLLSGEVTADG